MTAGQHQSAVCDSADLFVQLTYLCLDVHSGKNQELIAASSSDRHTVVMRRGTSGLRAGKSPTGSVFQGWLWRTEGAFDRQQSVTRCVNTRGNSWIQIRFSFALGSYILSGSFRERNLRNNVESEAPKEDKRDLEAG